MTFITFIFVFTVHSNIVFVLLRKIFNLTRDKVRINTIVVWCCVTKINSYLNKLLGLVFDMA